MNEELAALKVAIKEMYERLFPNYPIIEEILVKEVLYIWGTKGKEN